MIRTSKNRKSAKAKAWKYFSEYIRRRNAKNDLVVCVTCNKLMHWKKAHAGHFMSRRYEATLFDEKNVQIQCVSCNTFNQGRQFEFGQWIDRTYGAGTAAQLELKSKMKCFRKKWHYEEIAKEYYQKLKEL